MGKRGCERASGRADPRPTGRGGQEADRGAMLATFIWSAGPGDQQEMQGEPAGEAADGKLLLAGASGETTCLLEPAGGTKNKRSVSVPPQLLAFQALPGSQTLLFSSSSVMASGHIAGPLPLTSPSSTSRQLPTFWAIPACFSPLHHLPLAPLSSSLPPLPSLSSPPFPLCPLVTASSGRSSSH